MLIIEIVLLILLIQLYVKECVHFKINRKENKELIKTIQCDISEDEITPVLIEMITSRNMILKKKLCDEMNNGEFDKCREIMDDIQDNCYFILSLFQYDEKLRNLIEPKNTHKEETVVLEETSTIIDGNSIRQGRMNL